MLTQERLKECLSYDPDSGDFVALVDRRLYKAGDVFRTVNSSGYIRIRIDGVYHYAHRLAWMYVHGEWPPADLDHINRNRVDNRLSNLRLATRRENLRNRSASRSSATGVKGVDYHEGMKKYRVRIRSEGRRITIGYFGSVEEAALAYEKAAAEHHGKFAAHNSGK